MKKLHATVPGRANQQPHFSRQTSVVFQLPYIAYPTCLYLFLVSSNHGTQIHITQQFFIHFYTFHRPRKSYMSSHTSVKLHVLYLLYLQAHITRAKEIAWVLTQYINRLLLDKIYYLNPQCFHLTAIEVMDGDAMDQVRDTVFHNLTPCIPLHSRLLLVFSRYISFQHIKLKFHPLMISIMVCACQS